MMRGRFLAALLAGASALAISACVSTIAPRGYEICNEFGNESGCGDNVEIEVVNEG